MPWVFHVPGLVRRGYDEQVPAITLRTWDHPDVGQWTRTEYTFAWAGCLV